MASVVGESFFLSVDPLLPYKLSEEFGYSEAGIGVFFFQFTAVVFIFTLVLLLVPKTVNRIIFILTGVFAAAVGAFLTGPSLILGLPNRLTLISIGMATSGVARSLIQNYQATYVIKSGENAFRE